MNLIVFLLLLRQFNPIDGQLFKSPYEIESLYYPQTARDGLGKASNPNCGVEIRRQQGWIQSPNYPRNYPDSSFCVFTIHRINPSVCKIEVSFSDFDIEDTRPLCTNDYVDIGQGVRMCGILLPDVKFTTMFPERSNYLNIVFRSDSRVNRKGFMAYVNQISDSCEKTTTYPSVNRGPWSPDGASHIPFDDFLRNSCDQNIADYQGFLKSPNFPSDYPPNKQCIYTIKRPANHVCQVDMIIRTMNLYRDGLTTSCHSGDFLELPDKTRLCGETTIRSRSFSYPLTSDFLSLLFNSDSSGSSLGFNIEVRQVPFSCNLYQQSKATKCDMTITKDTHRIRSPGYPGYYGPKEQCVYTVYKANPKVCSLLLDFLRFNLQLNHDRNGLCDRDFFQLPDGSRLCGDVSGRKSVLFPPETNGSLIMIFSSDDYKEDLGYDIIVRQIPCGQTSDISQQLSPRRIGSIPDSTRTVGFNCNKLISKDQAVITSPNYPRDYPPHSSCKYVVRKSSPDVCEVRLQFLNFDLEKTSDCRADYFLIDHTNEKLCGKEWSLPEKDLRFPLNSELLRFTFFSDGEINRPGFEIQITQILNSCAAQSPTQRLPESRQNDVCDQSSASNIVFRSVNYPAPYSGNLECIYRIKKASSLVCRVEIYFSDFSVGTWEAKKCFNDYLLVNGQRYCGYRRGEKIDLNFNYDQQSIDLMFKTDGQDNYGGFRLDIRQVSDKCVDWRSLSNLPLSLKCPDTIFSKPTFQIISPGIEKSKYPSNLDCFYEIRKSSFDVCALEVKFNIFDLEESGDCSKDYLLIKGFKLCGKLPLDSKRTYEFNENQMQIRFHSDFTGDGSGFLLTVKQVICS